MNNTGEAEMPPLFIMERDMFEAIMMICFGASWPASIYKSFRVKKVTGKSILFLWLVFTGYVAGFAHKLVNNYDWVIVFYATNGLMVLCDIVLYYRYRNNS
jgi:hypothetical protein